jgi:uridylate kinase
MKAKYQTVILKLSGEALADSGDKTILDQKKLQAIADTVVKAAALGVHIGVVVGAGNIWRGRLAEKVGIEQATGDYMGMLGTIINALALQSAFEEKGLDTRVMSSINVPQVCEPYIRRKAVHHLNNGRIVIFAGGTGNPFFTTDSDGDLTGARSRSRCDSHGQKRCRRGLRFRSPQESERPFPQTPDLPGSRREEVGDHGSHGRRDARREQSRDPRLQYG